MYVKLTLVLVLRLVMGNGFDLTGGRLSGRFRVQHRGLALLNLRQVGDAEGLSDLGRVLLDPRGLLLLGLGLLDPTVSLFKRRGVLTRNVKDIATSQITDPQEVVVL